MQKALRRMSKLPWKPRYFDIGVNFSASMFQGCYNGSKTPKHPADIDKVTERAHLFNVDRMLITASSLKESQDHFRLVEEYPNRFFSTVGVHPCTVAQEFYVKKDGAYTEELAPDVDSKLQQLKDITEDGVKRGFVKAFGEIGLDYDRLHYSTKSQQLTMFRKQLEVAAQLKAYKLPLFLHMRSACADFIDIITPFIERGDIIRGNGVVHSFTGTKEELQKVLDLGFYIGVNGCSLKSDENLEVARLIPREKLMIETDAPWCEIRKSHASYKYISPYPNKFFPKLPEFETEKPSVSDINSQLLDVSLRGKKKQLPGPKQTPVKMDDFLPFPSIKKENYHKHQQVVAGRMKTEESTSPNHPFGDLSYPLYKSRNEPVFVGYVAEIMSELYGIKDEKELELFIDLVFENSCALFNVN